MGTSLCTRVWSLTEGAYSRKKGDPPQLNRGELNNPDGPIAIKEIEFIIKIVSERNFWAVSNVTAFEVSFTGEFNKT